MPGPKKFDESRMDLERHIGKYYGKYSGIVTDNKDKDTDEGKGLGKIKVKIPSILPEDKSVWARPCFAYGDFFVPPVGAYVWVEFEAGDIRYPIWSGVWYPADKRPNAAATDDNVPTARVVRTEKHEIRFIDTGGEEQIKIIHKCDDGAEGDRYMIIDNDMTNINYNEGGNVQISKKDGHIEINLDSPQGGQPKHMHMNKGGIEILSPNEEIKVSVTGGKCKVTASEITISALQKMTLQAGIKIDIKSAAIAMTAMSVDVKGGKIGLAAPNISMG